MKKLLNRFLVPIRSFHLGAILIILLALVTVYNAWPWREWSQVFGIWLIPHWLLPLYNLAILEYSNHVVGSLFLIPITYAGIFFGWPVALLTWALSMAVVFPQITSYGRIMLILTNAIFLLFPLLISSAIAIELKLRARDRRTYFERETERKEYITRVFQAQEDERQHIARELHDGIIQTLIVTANRANSLIQVEPKYLTSDFNNNLEWIRDTSLKMCKDIRRITLHLRPAILDNMGLIPALRWLANQVKDESGIDIDLSINGQQHKMTPEKETIIFRILQESLNNVVRHSGASSTNVHLSFKAQSLHIIIHDNGRGFSVPKSIKKFTPQENLGLVGIKQRVQLLGGTLRISSDNKKGTTLFMKLNCY